ncbi:hypothetical protein ANO14919_071240 [Xylariales sp. No.14919]|nr:hypothetical protein ANO14919_071240 [Xylariales sp. No.14919]
MKKERERVREKYTPIRLLPYSTDNFLILTRLPRAQVLAGNADNNELDAQYSAAYAAYPVACLQAYARGGAGVDAITLQNEPLNSQGGGHVMMYLAADDHNTDVPGYPRTVRGPRLGRLDELS